MGLSLLSYEVADFFEPSIEAAVVTIKAQIDAASGAVNVSLQRCLLHNC